MARKGKIKKFAAEASDERPVRFRKYQYLFLIVCEDQKTERAYFEKFERKIPPDTIYLKTVGTGLDSKGVVEKSMEERQLLSAHARREVDATWAVFDTDDANSNMAKAQRFLDAIKIGKANNINLACSNEVFELWLLLHLTAVGSRPPLPRREVYGNLQECVRQHPKFADFEYEHGNVNILEIIAEIGDENAAIERAETLQREHGKREPINANPSTWVHLLVRDLLGWIQYYAYSPEN